MGEFAATDRVFIHPVNDSRKGASSCTAASPGYLLGCRQARKCSKAAVSRLLARPASAVGPASQMAPTRGPAVVAELEACLAAVL